MGLFRKSPEEKEAKRKKKFEKISMGLENEIDKYLKRDYLLGSEEWSGFFTFDKETKRFYRIMKNRSGTKDHWSYKTAGMEYTYISTRLFYSIQLAAHNEEYEYLEKLMDQTLSQLNDEWLRFMDLSLDIGRFGLLSTYMLSKLGYIVNLYLFLLIVMEKYDKVIEVILDLNISKGVFQGILMGDYVEILEENNLCLVDDGADANYVALHLRYFLGFALYKKGRVDENIFLNDYNGDFQPKETSVPTRNDRFTDYYFPKGKVELIKLEEMKSDDVSSLANIIYSINNSN